MFRYLRKFRLKSMWLTFVIIIANHIMHSRLCVNSFAALFIHKYTRIFMHMGNILSEYDVLPKKTNYL